MKIMIISLILIIIKRFTNPYFRMMGLYKEKNETVKLPRVFNLLGTRIHQGKKQSRTHGTTKECIFFKLRTSDISKEFI